MVLALKFVTYRRLTLVLNPQVVNPVVSRSPPRMARARDAGHHQGFNAMAEAWELPA